MRLTPTKGCEREKACWWSQTNARLGKRKEKHRKWEIYSKQKRLAQCDFSSALEQHLALTLLQQKHLNQEFVTLYLNFSLIISTLPMMNHSKRWARNGTRQDRNLPYIELATASPSPISVQQCSTLITLYGWFRVSLLSITPTQPLQEQLSSARWDWDMPENRE